MTLLGKVFTGLVFVFSIVFFTLALAVNATHSKWRDAVMDPKTGYKVLNDRLKNSINEAKGALQSAQTELAQEQAARRQALSALQTQLDQERKQLADRTNENRALQASITQANQTLASTTEELKRLSTESAEIKRQIDQVMTDRNSQRAQVVSLTDALNDKTVVLNTLESKKKELTDSLTLVEAQYQNAQAALSQAGLKENPDDAPPPYLKGQVTAVGRDNLIEISLGRDDGVNVGHYLEVYRGGTYLGRIELRTVQDDKSVGKIVPNFRRGSIQVGDNVASRL
jgi:hypothetical protein